MTGLQRLLKSRQFGFLLVGGCIFLLQFFTLKFVVEIYGADMRFANLFIQISAVELSFIINKFFNWRDRTGGIWGQWWKFHHIRGLTFIFNQVVFFILIPLGVSYLHLNIGLAVLELVVHYILSDVYAFRKERG